MPLLVTLPMFSGAFHPCDELSCSFIHSLNQFIHSQIMSEKLLYISHYLGVQVREQTKLDRVPVLLEFP